MSRKPGWPLAAVAFAPIVAVVAFALFLVTQSGPGASDQELTFLLLIVIHKKLFAAIVALRFVVGTFLASHAWRHLRDSSHNRTLWAVRLFLFTEMRAPQYWLEHLR